MCNDVAKVFDLWQHEMTFVKVAVQFELSLEDSSQVADVFVKCGRKNYQIVQLY